MFISYYLPHSSLTNEDLEQIYNNPSWSASKIYRKTGIKHRYISDDENVSDMAVEASLKLFKEFSVSPEDVHFVLFCTQTPDYSLPTTACIVQDRLGIPTSSGALDYNLGCSGYIYGLFLAKSLLKSGMTDNVLLITSEAYSKRIHSLDRSTRTIFGDAATATFLTSEDIDNIGEFVLGSDGSGFNNLIVPAGGSKLPVSDLTSLDEEDKSGNIRNKNNLYMNGPEIYAFTLRVVPELVKNILERNNLTIDDIDYFVFHQANRFMLATLRDKLEIPEEKFCIDVEETGNTVSSTIPLTLKRQLENNNVRLSKGSKVMIAGFGVGYSWGGTVITI